MSKSNKHKVAIVLHKTDLTGGPGHSLLALVDSFNQDKYEYIFLASKKAELTNKLEAKGFSVKVIPYGVISKFWPFPFIFTLLKTFFWLKTNKIQLLHFQFDYYRDPYLLAAKVLNIPTLIHIRAKGLALKPSWLNLASGFIFNSSYTKTISGYHEFPADKQFVVHNAFRQKETNSKDQSQAVLSKTAEDQFTIGVVARIHPVKNILDAIRATHLLGKKHATHLHIAGNIQDQEYYKELLAEIDKLQMKDHVSFLGHLKNTTDFYNSLDCLVHPAHAEPFGLIFLEAAAARVPVISYAAAGALEILRHMDTALLARDIKPQALAEEIEKIIDSKDLAHRITAANFQNLENFDPQKQQEKIEEIYQKILTNA